MRIIWPSGVVQSETEFGKPAGPTNLATLSVTELDRKPSSCPFLYAWNGERFEFVTDFMGGGEMGYLEEPGRYNKPDPDEYVRLRGDQLREKNGKFEIRVTNELEEALFVDRLQLLAIAHPDEYGSLSKRRDDRSAEAFQTLFHARRPAAVECGRRSWP